MRRKLSPLFLCLLAAFIVLSVAAAIIFKASPVAITAVKLFGSNIRALKI